MMRKGAAAKKKASEVATGLGSLRFKNMVELMDYARLMAASGPGVPLHLRDNPGACLAIATRAVRFGFDPFALAEHSFLSEKGYGENRSETLAFDSFVIRAIIQAHAPITGALEYTYEGEGGTRRCTVTAKSKDGTVKTLTSPTLDDLKAARTEDGQLRGSTLWETKPDQQLGYDTGRDFCRLHHPEILLGWYDKDELQEHAPKTRARPKPAVGSRLGGNTGAGFSETGIAAALGGPDVAAPAAEPAASEPLSTDDSEPMLFEPVEMGAIPAPPPIPPMRPEF